MSTMIDMTAVSTVARIIVDVTRRCNLSCWYCHSSSGPEYHGPEIDAALMPGILRASDSMRTFDITITGGEPTMWKGLPDLLAASDQLEFATLQMITNATVVSDRTLRAMRGSRLKRICVSLDGPEDVHDRNRGAGTFRRTINGLQRLREAVDNVTVLTVLDRTSFDRWPELTHMLVELGVKQHHLCPVCFAGHAMEDYKGLDEAQFSYVRDSVDRMAPELAPDLILQFNDVLVRGSRSRTMALQTFTERFKGWQVIVGPDGQVKSNVRGWGRSWRTQEDLGNINADPLSRVLEGYSGKISAALDHGFESGDELRRKFHVLGANHEQVQQDVNDVSAVDRGDAQTILGFKGGVRPSVPVNELPLGVDLAELQQCRRRVPDRYRLREENGFRLLFDTVTFRVSILTIAEASTLQ